MRENAIEWITGEKVATVTLSQQGFINRVLKVAEADPDAVKIIETAVILSLTSMLIG